MARFLARIERSPQPRADRLPRRHAVGRAAPRDELARCHAFLLPFRVTISEVPLVVIEAGLSGRPTIVLAAPGVDEIASALGGIVAGSPARAARGPARRRRAAADRADTTPLPPGPTGRAPSARLLEPGAAGLARYRLVALAGVDGGGKTFLLGALRDRLDAAGVPHRHVWTRFRNYLSKPLLALARLTGHNRKEELGGVRTGYHDFAGRPWLAWPFLCLQVIDNLLDIWWRYHRSPDRRVVLADRCIYDTLVDLAVDTGLDDVVLGRLGHWLVRLLPAPRLAVVARPAGGGDPRRPGRTCSSTATSPAGGRSTSAWRGEFALPVLVNDGPPDAVLDRLERLAAGARAMIYVFYHNDPLAQDLGGGAEHFRCLHRALHRLGAAVPAGRRPAAGRGRVTPRSSTSRAAPASCASISPSGCWFWRRRGTFSDEDVFHFHRNYAAWPKLVLAPRPGRVLVSYHNVTGRVLEGWLGRLAAPLRRVMLAFERRVAALADAIICVSGRDRRELARVVAAEPFSRAHVVPGRLRRGPVRGGRCAAPPCPELARRLLILGRISHQKNVPLAVATLEALNAGGERWQLTIAGRGEGSKELIRLIARSPAAADDPLDRRRAARRGAGTAARARHPAADQPLRGLADGGQGGPARDAPGGQHRRRRRRRLAGEGPHRIHLRRHAGGAGRRACARPAG